MERMKLKNKTISRDLRPHVPLANLLANDYWGKYVSSKDAQSQM